MAVINPNPRKRVVDQPQPGWFKLRLVKGGPYVAAKIEQIGEEWLATINGEELSPRSTDPIEAAGVLQIWHSGQTIPEHEYEYKLELARWAQMHAPDHPAANPRKPIDLQTLPPVFQIVEREH